MRVKELKKNDVIRFSRRDIGEVLAIVTHTYESGGKAGARVTGASTTDVSTYELHIRDGQILELLWRETDS